MPNPSSDRLSLTLSPRDTSTSGRTKGVDGDCRPTTEAEDGHTSIVGDFAHVAPNATTNDRQTAGSDADWRHEGKDSNAPPAVISKIAASSITMRMPFPNTTAMVPLSPASSSVTLAASTADSDTADDSETECLQWYPTAMSSTRVNQIQLLSNFLEMHFPTTEAKMSLQFRRSYLMALPDMDLSSVPMLRSAVEAICFAHAGSNHKDDRLVQASQRAYGQVLKQLVRRVHGARRTHEARIVMSSIMILTLYDDTLPQVKASGWQAHYWGVHEFLKAAGTTAISLSDPFSNLLFFNLRVPMIFLGIAKRKAIVFAEPKWRAFSNFRGAVVTALGRLYVRGLHIPALLERADAVLQTKHSANVHSVMRDITAMRGDLISWSTSEATFADKTKKYYNLVSTTDDDAFDLTIEEHVVMSASSAFESLFAFASFNVAHEYTLYWMFCLVLDCALLRIMHFHPETEIFIRPRTRAEIERDATARAKYLCRSTYHWTRGESQGMIGCADTMVALAETFFSEISLVRELGWCQSVRVAFHMHGMRLRAKQPKTLCRMGDMAAEVATAARFKSKHVVANG